MNTLILDSPELELRVASAGLALYRSGVIVSHIPIRLVKRVIMQGPRSIETAVLSRLTAAGASVLILSNRQSRLIAVLSGESHSDAQIRLRQYDLCSSSSRCALLSQRLVQAKIAAQRVTLTRLLHLRPDLRHPFFQPLNKLRKATASLRSMRNPANSSILGVEGAAARSYFKAIASAFTPSLNFSGRTRRPPKDPVNACLSLAYTLLLSEAISAAHRSGLDPALGIYHQPAFGRPSLACDLIEPLRPHADFWVWSLFQQRVLRIESFQYDQSACRLTKLARGRFYLSYETLAATARRQLRRYASLLARQIRSAPTDNRFEQQIDTLPPDSDWEDGLFDFEDVLQSDLKAGDDLA